MHKLPNTTVSYAHPLAPTYTKTREYAHIFMHASGLTVELWHASPPTRTRATGAVCLCVRVRVLVCVSALVGVRVCAVGFTRQTLARGVCFYTHNHAHLIGIDLFHLQTVLGISAVVIVLENLLLKITQGRLTRRFLLYTVALHDHHSTMSQPVMYNAL